MSQDHDYSHRPAMEAYISERVAQVVNDYWQAVGPYAGVVSYDQRAQADQVARAEAIRAQADFFKLGLNVTEPLDDNGLDIDHEDYGR